MNKCDKMWLAAMIDGEGHMGIYKRTLKSSKNPSYYEVLQVDMNSKEIVERIHELVGCGWVWVRNTSPRTVWRWQSKNKCAREIITTILPYLIAKKREAEIILDLRSFDYDGKLPKIEIDRREELRTLIHKIRRV